MSTSWGQNTSFWPHCRPQLPTANSTYNMSCLIAEESLKWPPHGDWLQCILYELFYQPLGFSFRRSAISFNRLHNLISLPRRHSTGGMHTCVRACSLQKCIITTTNLRTDVCLFQCTLADSIMLIELRLAAVQAVGVLGGATSGWGWLRSQSSLPTARLHVSICFLPLAIITSFLRPTLRQTVNSLHLYTGA